MLKNINKDQGNFLETPLINKIDQYEQTDEYKENVKKFMQVDKMRIEPKTIFANERTYTKWLHFGILIVTAGFIGWKYDNN